MAGKCTTVCQAYLSLASLLFLVRKYLMLSSDSGTAFVPRHASGSSLTKASSRLNSLLARSLELLPDKALKLLCSQSALLDAWWKLAWLRKSQCLAWLRKSQC